jgi:hypothetical protein
VTNRSRGALAVTCVFGALVVATFAAFFVTTKLKRSPPVVEQLTFRRHFSPNGDGRLDIERIAFRLKRSDDVTVSIVSASGDRVATIVDDARLSAGRHRFSWDGRGPDGKVADGEYHIRVGLRRQGRVVTSPLKLFVDNTPPAPVVKFVTPDTISPDGSGSNNRVRIRFVGPTRVKPTLLVYRTGRGRPQLVARREGTKGSAEMTWDGRVGLGTRTAPAPAGNYLVIVRSRDAAGNDGPVNPPTRAQVRGHPGVVVRYLSAIAPRDPVRAGSSGEFDVQADGRRYRWSIARAGASRPLRSGRSRARRLHVHVPRTRRSGVYLLRLTLGKRSFRAPFAVQSPRRAKVLVVLPATTWWARDPVDANDDGYADQLPQDRVVTIDRPLAGGGLPRGFAADLVPTLEFLDRERFRYDVATDLASGLDGAALGRYTGVLFVGSPVFELDPLAQSLDQRVRAGAHLAWIGERGFTARTRLDGSSLVRGEVLRGRNEFGERLRGEPLGGLLSPTVDQAKLFEDVPAPFGPFPALELQVAPPGGSRVVAAASPDGERPAIVDYRYGKGFVTRIGVAAFGRSLERGSGLESSPQIMSNLWKLLS